MMFRVLLFLGHFMFFSTDSLFARDNLPPLLSSPDHVEGLVDTEVIFSISATHPENRATTLRAERLPDGAQFLNGKFSWRPTGSQAGTRLLRSGLKRVPAIPLRKSRMKVTPSKFKSPVSATSPSRVKGPDSKALAPRFVDSRYQAAKELRGPLGV
jgi:hypothetical protein